ncbi:putative CASP-like protein PIMP1-like [Capsicum annuum]|nr:putative CASP-like protein PIMP1-like [Capsicum annuum]
MWLKKVFLIFATLFYCFSLVGGCHEGERAALMSFKSLLTDPSNRLSSGKAENCCNWKGIKCSSSGRVVVVNLRNPHPDEVMINVNKEVVSSSNNASDFALKGNISPLLFTLDHIQHLDLSFNNFMFSKLPVEISNLTKLTYLNLSNSMFQDSIDMRFSNLTSLRSLDLSCANLVPDLSSITVSLTLPPKLDSGSLLSFISYGYLSSPNLRWLEGLRRLRYLISTDVDLSKPSESFHWAKPISSLSNLISLQLSNCNILGRIPTAQLLNLTRCLPSCILQLPKLSCLYVQKNNLNGDTPLSLFRKSRLNRISFGVSGLSVEINDQDQSLVQTFQPEILEFTSCNMRGEIPKFFSNLTSLVILILANNSLSGAIPYWLFNLLALSVLDLSMNNFKGVIPPTIQLKSSPYPTIISLADNNLQGPIPSKFENVNVIDLSLTNLVGSIPTQIGEVHGIRSISLSGNKIHGPIPESLCQAANVLQVLDLSNNSMSGTIRRNLSNFKSLIYLNLGENKLTGSVPKELERVTSLRYLDLNGNEFEGSFPTAIQKFQDLKMLNLAGNRFEGRIPNSPVLEIVTKRQTRFLVSVYSYNTGFDVSSNALTGKIPEKIGLLNGIPFLNLSHNNLTGLIPKTIGEMISLESLDLSYNQLTGEITVTLTLLNFLAYLNLSYNNLSGRIPTNPQFDTLYQDGTAYVGNKYLCGTPDGMNCSNN